MCSAASQLARATQRDLEQVIEPLASYICATDRPRAALNHALALLLGHVKQTNRLASARLAAVSLRRPVGPGCGC